MALKQILTGAYRMLKDRPVLFLPRILLSLAWSGVWLYLLNTLTIPLHLTQTQLTILLGAMLVLTPLQIWLFNTYICLVDEHHRNQFDLWQGAKDGLSRLPHGIAVFAFITILSILLSLPATVMIAFGMYGSSTGWLSAGVILFLAINIGLGITLYLVPASVVLGDDTLIGNILRGTQASRHHLRETTLLTLLSFGLLLATSLVEGIAQTLGIIGFVVGRLVAAVLGVYIMIVNPELFLQHRDEG